MTDSMTFGDRLHPADRAHVLDAYPYRMTAESCRRWPAIADLMRRGGFRLPIISDEEWLRTTEFRIRKDGRLDQRSKYCHSHR